MSIIGLVPVFEEADAIGYCVESMLAAGCSRVVVLDGAYKATDGSTFMDGGCASRDGTIENAELAGAQVIIPDRQPHFGEKRQMLIELSGAEAGDHLLFMDADERAVGHLDQAVIAWGHSMVIVRNYKPNDLPDLRGEWPRGDAGTAVPLLRLLRWSPSLRFHGGGRWADGGVPIRPYLVEAFAAMFDTYGEEEWLLNDPVLVQAHRAIRELEQHLTPELACMLSIVQDFCIEHVVPHSAERVRAKRRFYQ